MTDNEGFRVDGPDARGVVTITLDDPAKMNRVPLAARAQLAHLFVELGADDGIRLRRPHRRRRELHRGRRHRRVHGGDA